MEVLLDTSVFLWWNLDADVLNMTARAAISDPRNDIFVSAASVWEISIKRSKGHLHFETPVAEALAPNGFMPLPMSASHAERAGALAWTHKNPFDRILVAQAQQDRLTLLPADQAIQGYALVVQLWAR